ncbi:MAG: YggS family pyridoxal phosphate-dependent enzyme [Spirochaetaceae bacterium]|jgi:pyridoxal phosphate enzyme (YggS family)|nr:YggS family pyridoxal phosphate-dependent enzyme [Spirochaetaceae bacterium]
MTVSENLARIRDEINEVCLRIGRCPDEVRLMAVSKFHELPLIEEAAEAGLRLFGESRVQEATLKFLPFKRKYPDAELHMIGSLQRNKVKAAVTLFDCIESLDRNEVIRALGTAFPPEGETEGKGDGGNAPLPVLFELNAGEETKSGFRDEDALCAGVEAALGFPSLKPAGLMTMAPFTGDEAAVRKAFRGLVKAQTRLRREFSDCDWGCLSMGMSGDFKIAIEEGSTLLRIGTAIFGERE